ncbi:MAG: czcC 2 [Myxococcaceae bacterium]|nr:czcC 2 [Myxococcaceae bacterium]
MVGLDYWLTPTLSQPNSYGAMVTMSLPWLNPEHRAQARAADQNVRADRFAAETVQKLASLELHQAVAGLDAAKASLEILERDLLPQAEQSLQATQSSFSIGQSDLLSLLDALRSFFQVRLEHSRAYARVMSQLADVEFASGASLFPTNHAEPQP